MFKIKFVIVFVCLASAGQSQDSLFSIKSDSFESPVYGVLPASDTSFFMFYGLGDLRISEIGHQSQSVARTQGFQMPNDNIAGSFPAHLTRNFTKDEAGNIYFEGSFPNDKTITKLDKDFKLIASKVFFTPSKISHDRRSSECMIVDHEEIVFATQTTDSTFTIMRLDTMLNLVSRESFSLPLHRFMDAQRFVKVGSEYLLFVNDFFTSSVNTHLIKFNQQLEIIETVSIENLGVEDVEINSGYVYVYGKIGIEDPVVLVKLDPSTLEIEWNKSIDVFGFAGYIGQSNLLAFDTLGNIITVLPNSGQTIFPILKIDIEGTLLNSKFISDNDPNRNHLVFPLNEKRTVITNHGPRLIEVNNTDLSTKCSNHPSCFTLKEYPLSMRNISYEAAEDSLFIYDQAVVEVTFEDHFSESCFPLDLPSADFMFTFDCSAQVITIDSVTPIGFSSWRVGNEVYEGKSGTEIPFQGNEVVIIHELEIGGCIYEERDTIVNDIQLDYNPLGMDRSTCEDSIVINLPTANIERVRWENGSRDTERAIRETGVYQVTMTYENGCVVKDVVEIEFLAGVENYPKIGDTVICEGEAIQMQGIYEEVTGYWISTMNETLSPTTSGQYNYILKNDCEEVERSIYVEVETCIASSADSLFFPNIFSPNNDGVNDAYEVEFYGYIVETFEVYDRWGGQLFNASGERVSWDGYVDGELAHTGVYAAKVVLRNIFTNERVERIQSVTLVR